MNYYELRPSCFLMLMCLSCDTAPESLDQRTSKRLAQSNHQQGDQLSKKSEGIGGTNPSPSEKSDDKSSNKCSTSDENAVMETRTMYLAPFAPVASDCQSELQVRVCKNGGVQPWNGSYAYPSCQVEGSGVASPTCKMEIINPRVAPGEFALIYYEVSENTASLISDLNETLPLYRGLHPVPLKSSRTISLTAKGAGGEATCSIFVKVDPGMRPSSVPNCNLHVKHTKDKSYAAFHTSPATKVALIDGKRVGLPSGEIVLGSGGGNVYQNGIKYSMQVWSGAGASTCAPLSFRSFDPDLPPPTCSITYELDSYNESDPRGDASVLLSGGGLGMRGYLQHREFRGAGEHNFRLVDYPYAWSILDPFADVALKAGVVSNSGSGFCEKILPSKKSKIDYPERCSVRFTSPCASAPDLPLQFDLEDAILSSSEEVREHSCLTSAERIFDQCQSNAIMTGRVTTTFFDKNGMQGASKSVGPDDISSFTYSDSVARWLHAVMYRRAPTEAEMSEAYTFLKDRAPINGSISIFHHMQYALHLLGKPEAKPIADLVKVREGEIPGLAYGRIGAFLQGINNDKWHDARKIVEIEDKMRRGLTGLEPAAHIWVVRMGYLSSLLSRPNYLANRSETCSIEPSYSLAYLVPNYSQYDVNLKFSAFVDRSSITVNGVPIEWVDTESNTLKISLPMFEGTHKRIAVRSTKTQCEATLAKIGDESLRWEDTISKKTFSLLPRRLTWEKANGHARSEMLAGKAIDFSQSVCGPDRRIASEQEILSAITNGLLNPGVNSSYGNFHLASNLGVVWLPEYRVEKFGAEPAYFDFRSKQKQYYHPDRSSFDEAAVLCVSD